jgi:molecular chaperone GrpE (heat shock protein)
MEFPAAPSLPEEPEAVLSAFGEAAQNAKELAHKQQELHRILTDYMQATSDTAALRSAVEDALRKMSEVAQRQAELQNLIETRLQSDEVQGKAIERLHDQLQDYKNKFVRQAMLPLLKDIIFCTDFIAQELDLALTRETPTSPVDAARALEHLKQMLLDILFKYDIEPFRSEGGLFDRKMQQCIKTIPTANEQDDKKLAGQGVAGFREGDAIIRKEQVVVYKYSPA